MTIKILCVTLIPLINKGIYYEKVHHIYFAGFYCRDIDSI